MTTPRSLPSWMLHSSREEQIIHIINTYILSLGRKEVPEKRVLSGAWEIATMSLQELQQIGIRGLLFFSKEVSELLPTEQKHMHHCDFSAPTHSLELLQSSPEIIWTRNAPAQHFCVILNLNMHSQQSVVTNQLETDPELTKHLTCLREMCRPIKDVCFLQEGCQVQEGAHMTDASSLPRLSPDGSQKLLSFKPQLNAFILCQAP